jgi:hypothetical protein
MKVDISELLQGWDYVPGQVIARRFQGDDGREKVQLRVDLGILQMNAEGRPDGKRPRGQESWFHFYQRQHAQAVEKASEGEVQFALDAADCGRLQQEAIQYHHRYICFFQLEDFDAVAKDCERNLEVFRFVDEHAASDDLAWTVLQFTPQLLMMRTRASGAAELKTGNQAEAIGRIESGIDDLEGFYRENDREDLIENSGELHSLRQWLDDVRNRKPAPPATATEREKLLHDLAEAIRVEDYEKAARVRDQLRQLPASES